MYCVLHAIATTSAIHLMTVSMLNTALFSYLKRQDQRISKTCKSIFVLCSSWNLQDGAHFLHLACQGRRHAPLALPSVTPLPTVEKCRPLKPRVKAKSSLSGRNYFIAIHHQAGVNCENFTEVKFRDILLTGMGHRDRRLNWDSPGQTYGKSKLNKNLKPKSNFRFIRERPFALPSFHQKCRPLEKCRPGALPPPAPPPLVGSLGLVEWPVASLNGDKETFSQAYCP